MAASVLPSVESRTQLQRTSFPQWLFRTLHLWIGLSFGLLLVAQGLSGTALVWRPELDRMMVPTLATGQASPPAEGPAFSHLDDELRAVQAAAPGGTVRVLRLASADRGVHEWMVQLPVSPSARDARSAGRWTVYTSASTGQVLGIRGRQKDALQWLIELHHNLLLGPAGRTLQGVLALATVLLSLTGLWLWWPRRWMSSRFRPRAAVRPLHYALGFWAMWPLLAIAITSMYFVWRQPVQHLFGVKSEVHGGVAAGPSVAGVSDLRPEGTGSYARRQGRRSGHADDSVNAHPGEQNIAGTALPMPVAMNSLHSLQVLLTAAQSAAQSAVPGAQLTMLRLPDGRGPYTVMFANSTEHYRDAPNSLTMQLLPGGQAKVIRRSVWADVPAKQRFLEWLPRVHQGEFGGVPVRILWSAVGLMPAVLYISGFVMWRRRLDGERRRLTTA